MSKVDRSNMLQGSVRNLLILCLGVFCMMVIVSPLSFDAASTWFNHQSDEQQPPVEFEDDIFILAIFVFIAARITAGQMHTKQQPIYSTYPPLHLPPPK